MESKIKAGELRYGNKLLKNGEIVTVINVFGPSGLVQFKEEPFQRIPIGVADIKGVELSEQVLLKARFFHVQENAYYFNRDGEAFEFVLFTNQTPVAIANGVKRPFYYMFNGMIIEVSYLHEIQNVIGLVSKKELEFKA